MLSRFQCVLHMTAETSCSAEAWQQQTLFHPGHLHRSKNRSKWWLSKHEERWKRGIKAGEDSKTQIGNVERILVLTADRSRSISSPVKQEVKRLQRNPLKRQISERSDQRFVSKLRPKLWLIYEVHIFHKTETTFDAIVAYSWSNSSSLLQCRSIRVGLMKPALVQVIYSCHVIRKRKNKPNHK